VSNQKRDLTFLCHPVHVVAGSSGTGTESDEAAGETGQAQSRFVGIVVAAQNGISCSNHDDERFRVSF